jgi:hypothetical protein
VNSLQKNEEVNIGSSPLGHLFWEEQSEEIINQSRSFNAFSAVAKVFRWVMQIRESPFVCRKFWPETFICRRPGTDVLIFKRFLPKIGVFYSKQM